MKEQYKIVKDHLKTNGNITSWDAIRNYRITRLSHYIWVLRNEGYDITSVWTTNNKNRFVSYKLNNFPDDSIIKSTPKNFLDEEKLKVESEFLVKKNKIKKSNSFFAVVKREQKKGETWKNAIQRVKLENQLNKGKIALISSENHSDDIKINNKGFLKKITNGILQKVFKKKK